MARKLVKLNIKETSGVDHPAHLTEGWVVMKSADPSDVTAVLDELRPTDEVVEAAPVVRHERHGVVDSALLVFDVHDVLAVERA